MTKSKGKSISMSQVPSFCDATTGDWVAGMTKPNSFDDQLREILIKHQLASYTSASGSLMDDIKQLFLDIIAKAKPRVATIGSVDEHKGYNRAIKEFEQRLRKEIGK